MVTSIPCEESLKTRDRAEEIKFYSKISPVYVYQATTLGDSSENNRLEQFWRNRCRREGFRSNLHATLGQQHWQRHRQQPNLYSTRVSCVFSPAGGFSQEIRTRFRRRINNPCFCCATGSGFNRVAYACRIAAISRFPTRIHEVAENLLSVACRYQ